MHTFDEKGNQKVSEKLKTLQGNNLESLYGTQSVESIMSSGISSLSFGSFLKDQNYTENDKKLIKTTMKDPLNILELIKIHYDDIGIPEPE